MRPACLAGGGAHVKTTVAQDDGARGRRCDGRGTQCAENSRRPADSAVECDEAAYPDPDGRIWSTLNRLQSRTQADRRSSKARLGDEVDVKYVYNVLDLGYREDDINCLVDEGVLTLGYQSSGYFSESVPRSTVASGRCWPQSSKRG